MSGMISLCDNRTNSISQQSTMISSTTLLLITILSCIYLSFLQLVNADAVDDLWNKYMQQADTSSQQAKSYESTITRRERNLDHWDVPTAAAYLGLHPKTLQPLPKYASDVSSAQDTTTTASNSLTSSTTQTSSQQLTDEYIGHDAAILFYAQWCRNCHAVAPSWDAIATHINAGSTSSNIVMALFDCEKNKEATQLCLNAGITAYPTIMFVGRTKIHDTDFITKSILGKDKSAGPYGATTLDRTVKFQGNWQYADQILDWISIMKGISYWGGVTDSGPLRSVRNVLFGLLTGGKYNKNKGKNKGGGSLPVGVPPNFQPELRGIGGSSSGGGTTVDAAASAQEVKALEIKLNATAEEKKLYEKAVSHSSQLLNGMLFPSSKNDTEEAHRDVFTILTKSDGWYSNATTLPNEDTPNDEHPSILRSCALELSIDYCTRITTRETNKYLEVLSAIPESDPFPSLEEIESHLLDEVKKQEPYCGLIETCMVSNFEELEECRPEVCPFVNEAACTYLESCLDPTVQDEYGVALGLIKEGEKIMDKDFSLSVAGGTGSTVDGDDKASDTKTKAGVGGWGVPV